jgi:hypothetical protein
MHLPPRVPKNGLERCVWQFYTICDNKSASKSKNWESYGNFSTQIAGFQLAGPVADASKICMVKIAYGMGSPNEQYKFGNFPSSPS